MEKILLVIKNPEIKLHISDEYLILKSQYEEKVVGYQYIEKLYIHHRITLNEHQISKIKSYFNWQYFVGNGYKVYARF